MYSSAQKELRSYFMIMQEELKGSCFFFNTSSSGILIAKHFWHQASSQHGDVL